jgi:small-conductance mechanosensitive channel
MSADLAIRATSFVQQHDDELTAVASIATAIVVAVVLDRVIARRGRGLAAAVGAGDMTPVAVTRLRVLRRLVSTAVLLLGVLVALTQFPALSRVATGLLASGALAAAAVGFAARPVLANAVAGVMLAITQPLRIGDRVAFEGAEGEVEDVRLNYTYLRTAQGTRVVIPNERLASGMLRNDTVARETAPVEVTLWLGRDADAERAAELLSATAEAQSVSVSDITPDGVCLSVAAAPVAPDDVADAEARLRLACLRALRVGGLTEEAARP